MVAARLDDAPDFAIPFVDDRNSGLRSRPDCDWDHAGDSRYSSSRYPGLLCSMGCYPSDWYVEVPVAGIMGIPGTAPDSPAAAGRVLGSMVVRARQLGGMHIGKDRFLAGAARAVQDMPARF